MFLGKLRVSLNDIFGSYKSEQPEREYRVFVEEYGASSVKKELWVSEKTVIAHVENNRTYFNPESECDVPLERTAREYGITIPGSNNNIYIANQQQIQNNYNQDSQLLRDHLNALAGALEGSDAQSDAQEFHKLAVALKKIETLDPEEAKESGVLNRIKRMLDELGEEDSALNKAIKGVKHGVSIAQDVGKMYNRVAQWVGAPQVPDVFLQDADDSD